MSKINTSTKQLYGSSIIARSWGATLSEREDHFFSQVDSPHSNRWYKSVAQNFRT
jgi:hypothetical protein